MPLHLYWLDRIRGCRFLRFDGRREKVVVGMRGKYVMNTCTISDALSNCGNRRRNLPNAGTIQETSHSNC